MPHESAEPLRASPPTIPKAGDEESLDVWGFRDSGFRILPNGSVLLTGSRYALSGVELPERIEGLNEAAAAQDGGNGYALVIGVDDYGSIGLARLANAEGLLHGVHGLLRENRPIDLSLSTQGDEIGAPDCADTLE